MTGADRMLWVWLSNVWNGWRDALVIVKPETVLAWHRRGFRLFWTWKSRRHLGRPGVPSDVRHLIRTMAEANPLWGAPRIHGELLKLGIDVSQAADEIGLSRILTRYVAYYHESRTHLSLAKDSPQPRPIAQPTIGPVVAIPQVGGLHHRYDRRAA